jgi:hypothetical protein
MQVEQMIMTASQMSSVLDISGVSSNIPNEVVVAESAILNKLLQGYDASYIHSNSGFDVSYINRTTGVKNKIGFSDASYSYLNPGPGYPLGSNMLINNTIIDTPNLGLLSYLDTSGFTFVDNSYVIGQNRYRTFYGQIYEHDPSSIVYITEDLSFDFVAADPSWNTDPSGTYFVSFNPSSSTNYWTSKAINSSLNCRKNGVRFKPMNVFEPSFNSVYAMGSINGQSNTKITEPFNYWYSNVYSTSTSGGDKVVPQINALFHDTTYGNDTSRLANNLDPSSNPLYRITTLNTNTGNKFSNRFGTWKIDQSGNSTITPTVSPTGTVNDLPFILTVSGESSYTYYTLPSTLTDVSFRSIFPLVNSQDDFSFNITATVANGGGVGGGYYFNETTNGTSESDDKNRSWIKDVCANPIAILDFTNLSNAPIYMKSGYQNKDHTLVIQNGALDISNVSNSDNSNNTLFTRGLGTESERLSSSSNKIPGSINLIVKNPTNSSRVKNVSIASGSGRNDLYPSSTAGPELSGNIAVYYATDNSGIKIDASWQTIEKIDISATCLLDGLRILSVDTSYGYYYSNKSINNEYNTNVYDPSSGSTLYAGHSVPGLRYTATGFSGDYTYIEISSSQTLVNKTFPYYYDMSLNPNGLPVPPDVGTLTADSSATTFVVPNIHAHNLNFQGLPPYNTYRAYYQTKRLTDLRDPSFGNMTLDPSNNWRFVYGTSFASTTNGVNYGDVSFNYGLSDNSGQYLYTKFNNLSVPGTNANGLNNGRACGINITDLKNPGDQTTDPSDSRKMYPYSFTVTYISSRDIGGTDLVDFSANNPGDFSGNCTRFTFKSIITDVSGPDASGANDFRAVVQVPIGEYYNLYMQTPWLKSSGNNESEDISKNTTTTFSFCRDALFSLLFSIQGNLADASYTDVSGTGWEDISVDICGNSGKLKDSISAYYPYTTRVYINDASNVASGYADITSTLNTYKQPYKSTYHLIWPAYAVDLDPSGDASFNVIGKQFSIENDASYISSTFNPSIFAKTSSTNMPQGGVDLSFYSNYTASGDGIDISGITNNSILAKIRFPSQATSATSIWYCPRDVYRVDVSLNGGSLTSGQSYTKYIPSDSSSDSSNNNYTATLAYGVQLQNTQHIQAGDSVKFDVAGDNIQVKLQNDIQDGQNLYWYSSEISGNYPLQITNQGKTRSLTIPYYRGYTNRSGNQQSYDIRRTKTTAQFIIGASGSIYDQESDFSDVNIDTSNVMNFVARTSDTTHGNIGNTINLALSFKESMLPDLDVSYGSKRTYGVSVSGDIVYVSETGNANSFDRTLNLKNGYLTPFGENTTNVNNSIYSGRVKTNGNNNLVYNIHKLPQQVVISYKSSYLNKPDSGPSAPPETTMTFYNSELIAGLQLTPDITLYGPSGSRDTSISSGTNTPLTYLVIPPPYIGFQALAADANKNNTSNGLPFDVSNSSQYDVSYNITWYAPVTTNTTREYDDVSWTPFSDTTQIGATYGWSVSSMNNMRFVSTNNQTRLTDYVKRDSSPKTFNLESKGNFLTITECTQGESSQLYFNRLFNGFLEDLSNNNVNSANTDNKLGYIDVSNQIYTIVFAQDLNSVGVDNGSTSKITLNLTNAFLHDVSHVYIQPTDITTSYLYGVSPVIDASNQYSLQLYRYTSNGINYGALTKTAHINILYYANKREYARNTIKVPTTITSTNTPYRLDVQRKKIVIQDISSAGGWIVDNSFNAGPINFELIALDNSGITLVNTLVDIYYPKKCINVNYITLPDIFTAYSAEYSPVYRILYNGSTISPMISTSQIIINPIANLEAFSNNDPNTEFVDFNIGTSAGVMADASGIVVL